MINVTESEEGYFKSGVWVSKAKPTFVQDSYLYPDIPTRIWGIEGRLISIESKLTQIENMLAAIMRKQGVYHQWW